MGLYRFSAFEYDAGPGRLRKHGLRLKLQQKPQTVLAALLEVPGKTITRQELHRRLWPDGVHVDFDQGLSIAVKKLRDALSDPSDDPKYIATVAGVGYRFIGKVEEVCGPEQGTAEALLRNSATPELQPRAAANLPEATELSMAAGTWITPGMSFRRKAAVAAVFAVLLGAFAFVFARSLTRPLTASTRSLIAPPPGWQLLTTQDTGGSVTLSPDGSRAVYAAIHPKLGTMLLMRKLDALSADPLPGTAGAAMPFWSPDGKRIGFFTQDELKTLDLASGSVHIVSHLKESPRGGAWGSGDTILIAASTRGPILRVPASGGQPVAVTDLGTQYTTHRWPEFLPDGRHFLFLAANHDPVAAARPAVFLGSLDGRAPRFLVESDSNAKFIAGRLLFVVGGKLLARIMDPDTGEVGSAATILTDNIEYDQKLWHASFAATAQLLIFRQRPEAPETQVITLTDSSGKPVKTASRPGNFRSVTVSPDGKDMAAVCDDPDMQVCLIHPDGTMTKISETPFSYDPIWSPDGAYLVYGTHRGASRFGLVLKDAKGQKAEQILVESDSSLNATSWNPNQGELLVERFNARGKMELAIFQLADHKTSSFVSGSFNVGNAKFSPDGKWVAYSSDESGQDEIYVSSYPEPAEKYKVSEIGGHAPRWGQNADELYFLDSSDTLHRVQFETAGRRLRVKSVETLFRPPILTPPYDSDSFDIVPQQRLFAFVTPASTNDAPYILATSWRH